MSKLALIPNPPVSGTRTCTLCTEVQSNLTGIATLEINYIPDRHAVTPESFSPWLKSLANQLSWEELVHSVMAHFYDEVLPYHAHLILHVDHEDGLSQTIEETHQQPGYKKNAA